MVYIEIYLVLNKLDLDTGSRFHIKTRPWIPVESKIQYRNPRDKSQILSKKIKGKSHNIQKDKYGCQF